MDIAFSHPITLIVNALGSPPPDMLEHAHSAGIKVGASPANRPTQFATLPLEST